MTGSSHIDSLFLSVVVAGAIVAQEPAADARLVPPGARVRVTTTNTVPDQFDAIVHEPGETQVTLRLDAKRTSITLPWTAVARFRESEGHHRRKGALIGALAGGIAGAVIYVKNVDLVRHEDYWGFERLFLGINALVLMPAVGAALGAWLTPESWHDAVVPSTTGAAARATLNIEPNDEVRLHVGAREVRSFVSRQTPDSLFLSNGETILWRDVRHVRTRGGHDRTRGALYGALAFLGIGVIGEMTEPTTSSGERIGAFTGAAAVGALVGSRYFAPTGWLTLPLPSR